MPAEITVVTTCRGRLPHLKRTLCRYVHHVPVVVVDYACPERTTHWLTAVVGDTCPAGRHRITAVRRPAEGFHRAAARNDGLALVRTRWVAFVDADTIVDGRLDRLDLSPGAYYVAHHPGPPPHYLAPDESSWMRPTDGPDLCGFLVAETQAVRRVGGYDERFVGWGAEDTDLRTMLAHAGAGHGRLPAGFLGFIPHDHAVRHGVSPDQAEAVHAERLRASDEAFKRKWAGVTSFAPADAGEARVVQVPGLTAA